MRRPTEHFRQDGRPKKAFASQAAAAEERLRIKAYDLQPYKCRLCPSWHLGHTPKRRTRRKK